jgi:hypothetical protein
MTYKNYLTPEQETLVWDNRNLTAKTLAVLAEAKVWHVRYFLYSKGFRKMEVEYWTDEMVVFLKGNFKEIGDKELAAIFQERWPKNKPWTLKHIEKKRNYLHLKRTRKELYAIHHRNKRNGSWENAHKWMWQTRGVSPIGATRIWPDQQGTLRKYIRTEKGFESMPHTVWKEHNGDLPEGWKIRFKDGNPLNCELKNLDPVSREEHGRRNALIASIGLSDNYVVSIQTLHQPHLRDEIKKSPELIELMRTRLLLNREINKYKEQH